MLFTDMTHHIQESQFLFFILALVYVNQGKHEEPLWMDQESLQKKRAIYGRDKAHSEIAASLSSLTLVCKGQRKLIKRIQFREEGPVIQRIIHGSNTSHLSIATMLSSLARSYQEFGQLQQAVVMREQSLDTKRAVYATRAVLPEIVCSFRDLSNVHALLRLVQKVNHYQEKSLEITLVIRERSSATGQRDLAAISDEATQMRISYENGRDDPLTKFRKTCQSI